MQNYSPKFKIDEIILRLCLRIAWDLSLTLKMTLFITFNFALLTFNLSKAHASNLSLAIYPPIIEIRAEPPAVINKDINIENHGEETVRLKIQFKPFTTNGENGEVLYSQTEENPLIFNNIKIRENDKTIEKVAISPKQSKTLQLHLDIPKNEYLSDYYFSVIFVSEDIPEERLNHISIQGGIATNVLLSIKGNPPLIGAKPTSIAKIVEFSSPLFLDKSPIPLKFRLKNQSNHFITPQGAITIKNIFGKIIGHAKIQPVNILANTSRTENLSWKGDFLLGYYTATLSINISDKEPALLKSVKFFVFPLKTLIILVTISFTIFLIKNRLKKYRKE